MIDPKSLLNDLKTEVKRLEMDLRPTGEEDPGLYAEWEGARAAERTATPFETWLTDRVTQVAVAWVLATVFVRFAEDNDLIQYPYLAGPGDERTAQARERQEEYLHHPDHQSETDRDWIKAAFDEMSKSPVAKALFAEHNPMWSILPANDAAKALLEFWRKTDANGVIIHDFTDKTWDTRFLGDLYQDLSEATRKTYALLQTPDFVEEFILKYTLDPAIEEFGLEPEPPFGHADLPRRLRVIDPACGSGHFLLGAFRRLLAAWEAHSPMTDKWQLIANALSSVHGVDKNPYAAAIARYRLMLAAMKEGNVTRLTEKVDFTLNIGIGDSLIHGDWKSEEQGEFELGDRKPPYMYRTEDIGRYIKSVEMLASGTYHAVFANPPYITVKDKAESDLYRKRYKSCYREYSLSVPFAERIFKLAVVGTVEGVSAGYTGQITANSFMKREFGKKLIEEYFAYQIDLTHIIDTSGAFIPGHGTPTVILFGRRRYGRSHTTVRAVLGVRGEPSEPVVPAEGFVWQAIEHQVDRPGSDSEWVTVADMPRDHFAKHPWSLSGGGASNLMDAITQSSKTMLGDRVRLIGRTTHTGSDEVYFAPKGTWQRYRVARNRIVPLVEGDVVRDWTLMPVTEAIFPYDASYKADLSDSASAEHLWLYRAQLQHRREPGGTHEEIGLTWYEWSRWHPERFVIPLGIAMAFVTTHNHFVLDRGGKVFNRSAPVIKLPEGATEDDHLGLLAVLNSSTACFWLKQVSHDKGNRGGERSTARYAWESFYEFTGTKLEAFPLVKDLPREFGRQMDSLAQQLASVEPSSGCADGVPTRARLDVARIERERIQGRIVALQEELDWEVYRRYGLISDTEAEELIARPESVPDLKLGERAFEFLLAERLEGVQGEKQWFERHRSTPVFEIPAHWSDAYKAVVARRIEFIKADRNIGLIERPECKRRWESEVDPWEKKERAALTVWLLNRCEDRSLWYGSDGQPRPLTVNNLADRLRADADFVSVARLLAGPDADLADVLAGILDTEHVPYLAQFRYKSAGLIKRIVWEQSWNLQRIEDSTGKTLDIRVPPKYGKDDFQRSSYWRHRGKLDVPKERFISYPDASPDGDDSVLLGWAGWDHREQAYALITLITQRSATDGWDTARLTPLIAGLAEIMPWVRQWHNEVDPSFGQSPADAYDEFLTAQRLTHHLTDQDLANWKPQPATRRKPGAARGKAGAPKSTGFVPVVLSDQ